MKTTHKLFSGLVIVATMIFFASCSSAPKGDEAKVGDEETVGSTEGTELVIDTDASKIGFTGNGVGKNHPGYFSISSGKVIVADGQITGGDFTINTKSLVLDQKDEMFQTKLKGHLLGPDFFDTDKYPTAKFEITSVEPYVPGKNDSSVVAGANSTVSGNLTLKDVTKNVSFPAKIDLDSNTLTALANFNIDRTTWGIQYGNDKSLKDKFISETVNITFDIKSK